jgi:SAM-dependent methyltransferase
MDMYRKPKRKEIKNYYSRYYPKMVSIWEGGARGSRRIGSRCIVLRKIGAGKFRGKKILDVGCGTGKIVRRLGIASTNEVYGLDISREFVREARGYGVKASVLDIEKGKFPYPKNYFDAIFMFDLIEHIFRPGILFKKCSRALKNGGIILATLPNWHADGKKITIQDTYETTLKQVYGKKIPEGAMRYADFNFITISQIRELLPRDIKIEQIHGFKWTWSELSPKERRDMWDNPMKGRDLLIVMRKKM